VKSQKTPQDQRGEALAMRTQSRPSDLKITDIRFADIVGAPMRCILMKIYTNQDIVGYGEVRDWSSRSYAALLKERLIGENPCDVDRLFRRIRQFGYHGRQGGGVSGIEVALWDLAGKAYGVPVYQLLGGKFRDRIRMYADTDWEGKGTAATMAQALKKRMDRGFTFLKMDLGLGQLLGHPGAIMAPSGFLEELQTLGEAYGNGMTSKRTNIDEYRRVRSRWYQLANTSNTVTGCHLTEKGVDILADFVAEVRQRVGYEIPIATDHFGPFSVEDAVRVCRLLEKFNLAWFEDALPWQYTDQYVRLSHATAVPQGTGEDIYLAEGFRPLIEANAVSVVHPDVLTVGGIMETKKVGDIALEHGIAMAIHMAESPVGCMAAVHAAAASENFLALEYHSADIPWWDDLVEGPSKPIVDKGFITVPQTPGLGIESLNDECIKAHLDPGRPGLWEPTDRWDGEWSHDRTWS
jgi:L-alanine-DL-glutamate epimerase-like enolase superfamily enzyme